MMLYRVSHVERFRQWECDEDADLDALIADIHGTSKPSQAMLAGSAFHKGLETAQAGEDLIEIEQNGFVFTFAEDFNIEASPIRELRASKPYWVDGEPIYISGQVDSLCGLRIEDHKTTARFDPDRYIAGYQWRLYLDIFDARQFRWNVFEMHEVDDPKRMGFAFELPPIQYEIFAMHRLEQYRYPSLTSDCEALVSRFARFVRGLELLNMKAAA